jgi:hypothetical protein
MNEILLNSAEISETFKQQMVYCVKKALTDDLIRYKAEFQPVTTNGVPHQISDFINTNITNLLPENYIKVISFSRSSWSGRIIVDEEHKLVYSIMRGSRLHSLQCSKVRKKSPHYIETVAGILNQELRPKEAQMTLGDIELFRFDNAVLQADYNNTFKGAIPQDENYHYGVVVYDTFKGDISDMRLVFLDKNMELIEEQSWSEYIQPDFTELTYAEPASKDNSTPSVKTNKELLKSKKKVPVKRRNEEKETQA